MIAQIHKSNLAGTIQICPSKSYEQRAWAIASLVKHSIEILNQGKSDDAKASKEICEKLKNEDFTQAFNCRESALCARMFPPIIALYNDNFTIDGHGTLLRRNIDRDLQFYESAFGWKVSHNGFPIHISNAGLIPGNYTIDGHTTSQIATGLILALSAQQGDSTLTIENPTSIGYILMTVDAANEAGAKITACRKDRYLEIDIKGASSYNIKELSTEGDWSNAAFLITTGLTTGDICISGLNPQSLQPDRAIMDVLDLCHANYEWANGSLHIHKSSIGQFCFDATDSPDLIPPLCALALNADGECSIKGVNRLTSKESNRLEAITKELGKLGSKVEAIDNSITINPLRNISPTAVDSHNDHRIAMMLSVIGLKSEGMTIHGCECVNKSYPEFFDALKSLGARIETSI